MREEHDRMELLEWDALTENEEYRALVRALRRKKGFRLFFVQVRQGDRVLAALQRDLAGRSFARVEIEREDEALYDKLDAVWEQGRVDVFWIDGLARSLLGYEDVKRRSGWDEAELTGYSDRDVPPILSHLNLGRERFMRRFDCALVFVVPLFAVRYLLKRSSDFFDWGSGFFEFADSLEERQQFVQEVMESADYKTYKALSSTDRDEKIFQIEERLTDSELDIEMKAKLWREIGRLFDTGKQYERAIVAFKRSLKVNPDYSDAWRNLGNSCMKLGRYEEAIEVYKKAIELNPEDASAYQNLGVTYSEQKRYEEAIVAYKKAIELNLEDALFYYSLGVTYSEQKRYEEAIEAYKKAIEINPEHASAYYSLGNMYYEQKQYEEAIEAYKKAIEFNPEDASAYYNLGITYKNQKRYEEAIEAYKKAIDLNPEDASAYYNSLGITYYSQKRYEEAIVAYQKAIELDPKDTTAYYSLGITYDKQKRYEEAIVAYQKAIELNPEDTTAYYSLGNTYDKQKRYEEAIEAYKKAIELNPKNADSYYSLGNTYSTQNCYGEAIEAYKKAIELDSQHSAHIYEILELVYHIQNCYEEAIEVCKKSIELDPENDRHPYFRSIAYQKLNQPQKAQADLQKAIDLAQANHAIDPNDWRNTFNLALCHLAAGNQEACDRLYRSGLDAPREWIEMAIRDLEQRKEWRMENDELRMVERAIELLGGRKPES